MSMSELYYSVNKSNIDHKFIEHVIQTTKEVLMKNDGALQITLTDMSNYYITKHDLNYLSLLGYPITINNETYSLRRNLFGNHEK